MFEFIVALVLLSIGLALLVKGADALVDGASAIARSYGVSELLVGLTIVAFGTSLPELIVSLLASFNEAEGLAIGNVVGSNIANILLILGVVAIIKPITVRRVTVWREVLFAMGAGGVLMALAADNVIGASSYTGLDRIDGLILMIFFAALLYYIFSQAFSDRRNTTVVKSDEDKTPLLAMSAKIGLGILGLALGGKLVIDNATFIASALSISDGIVGLTLIAAGTSAPELFTSVAAVKNRQVDLAVGNIVGSNLFNIFWVLGLSALISPLAFDPTIYADVVIAGACGVLLFGFMVFSKPRHTLSRTHGILFVILYSGYLVSLVLRGAA